MRQGKTIPLEKVWLTSTEAARYLGVTLPESVKTKRIMKTIISISFKEWLQLWQTLGLTILKIVLGLVIILFRGIIKTSVKAWKGLVKWIGAHPTGALAAFAFCIVIVALLSSVRRGIERRDLSYELDSISHVCDSLRNGDRYEAGYADGVKAMRNRKLESGL